MALFNSIVREIECNHSFANTASFITSPNNGAKQASKQMLASQVRQWASSMQSLLEQHYQNFDTNNLRMIVIGSTGFPGFNSKLAYVAERGTFIGPTGVPGEVRQFIACLNKALDRPNTAEYDYFCQQSKKHTLFVNVCPDANADSQWISAICTIRFINRILAETKQMNIKLAIFDNRQSKHIHRDDINIVPKFLLNHFQQKSQIESDIQLDKTFKIEHESHYFIRTGKYSLPQCDEIFVLTGLKYLYQREYRIDQFYILNHSKIENKLLRSSTSLQTASSIGFVAPELHQNVNNQENINLENLIVEDALQKSLELSDEQKQFNLQLEFIPDDVQFYSYLENIVKDQVDGIIAEIDEYLNYPHGINPHQQEWYQYVDAFQHTAEYQSSSKPQHLKLETIKQAESPKEIETFSIAKSNLNSNIQNAKTVKNSQNSLVLKQDIQRPNELLNNLAYVEYTLKEKHLPAQISQFFAEQPQLYKKNLVNDNSFILNQYDSVDVNQQIAKDSINCLPLHPIQSSIESDQLSNSQSNQTTHKYSIYLPKNLPVNESELIVTLCKPQFDRFIASRLKKTKHERNVISLRLLLTLTLKNKWFICVVRLSSNSNFKSEFIGAIKEYRFVQSQIDENLYYRKCDKHKSFILFSSESQHELLLASDDQNEMKLIRSRYGILIDSNTENLNVNNFLGINIQYDSDQKCFLLNQSEAIVKIIKKYEIKTTNASAKRPIAKSFDALYTNLDNCSPSEQPVSCLLADLLDISRKTRPDICAAVNILLNHITNPSKVLWNLAVEIALYLYQTKNCKLNLKPIGSLICFSDGSGTNVFLKHIKMPTLKNFIGKNDDCGDTKSIKQNKTFTKSKQTQIKSNSSDSTIDNVSKSNPNNAKTSQVEDTAIYQDDTNSVVESDVEVIIPFSQNQSQNQISHQESFKKVGLINSSQNALALVDSSSKPLIMDLSILALPKFSTSSAVLKLDQGNEISNNNCAKNKRSSINQNTDESKNSVPLENVQNFPYAKNSQTGYLLRSYQCPIPWSSEHVNIDDLETHFIELVGAARSAAELYITKQLLAEFGSETTERTEMLVDNQIVITMVEEGRRKYVENNEIPQCWKNIKDEEEKVTAKYASPKLQKYLYTLLYLAVNDIELTYVKTKDNTADLFTKVLDGNYDKIRPKVNLID